MINDEEKVKWNIENSFNHNQTLTNETNYRVK